MKHTDTPLDSLILNLYLLETSHGSWETLIWSKLGIYVYDFQIIRCPVIKTDTKLCMHIK